MLAITALHASPHCQVETEELIRMRARLLPPYKVILHNDDVHWANAVVSALVKSVPVSTQEAERIMWEAHTMGRAVVIVCTREEAEYYQDRLVSFGLDITIEPD